MSCSDNFHTVLPKYFKMTTKIFEIKFTYITNKTAKTSIKSHIYHYTTPCETVVCDSNGMTDDCISTDKSNTNFFNKLLPIKKMNYRGSS
jgi:hypothetical protein